jgi:hypothetical protein
MENTTRDPNKHKVDQVKKFCEQHFAGLITDKEFYNCVTNEVANTEDFIYAVGQNTRGQGDGLTYGVVRIIDRPGDLAIEIHSRCGDKVRIDKGAILTFSRAIEEVIEILEKRYPSVGQL